MVRQRYMVERRADLQLVIAVVVWLDVLNFVLALKQNRFVSNCVAKWSPHPRGLAGIVAWPLLIAVPWWDQQQYFCQLQLKIGKDA